MKGVSLLETDMRERKADPLAESGVTVIPCWAALLERGQVTVPGQPNPIVERLRKAENGQSSLADVRNPTEGTANE